MAKRILVIEDQENFRDVLEGILSNNGYEVTATPHLAMSVSEALTGSFDLITIDLKMPGIDGVEIAKLFCSHRLPPPILIISGFLDNGVKSSLEAAGVQHFLEKPAGVGELMSAVDRAIS